MDKQEKQEKKQESWFSIAKKFADGIRSTLSEKTGLQDPTGSNAKENKSDFEACQELTFESVVDWIQSNKGKVENCDGAVITKEENKEDEDYKYRVGVYFLKGKEVLSNEIRKTFVCNSIEEDLLLNFNGGNVFIVK